MVIVLKNGISTQEKERIKSFLGERNFTTNEVNGKEQSIIAAVGLLKIDPADVRLLPGVENVIPISKPYKLASREFNPECTVVEFKNSFEQKIRIGGQRLSVIAGPAVVEEKERLFAIAKSISESGACMLNSSAFKPRTSPYAFPGLGEEGVKILKEAGEKYALPVATEIIASEHLKIMKKYGVDCLVVGASNMQNYQLLKEIGKSRIPVILKRNLCATLEEWLMSAEYLLSEGTKDVILCERGIRTFENSTRNTLDLSAVPNLKSMTHLPVIVDPSNAVGIAEKIPSMALASVASGVDGLLLEVHNEPSKAYTSGQQALLPSVFENLMNDVEALSPVVGKAVVHIQNNVNPSFVSEAKNKGGKLLCAYNGVRGAYAEQAVSRHFDGEAEPLSVGSFREIFKAVQDGKADFGMVPIENSLGGSVYDNYDNLVTFQDISIVGAVHLRIQHALLACKGTSIDLIKRVYSHPQGFAQCAKLIEEKGWEKITVSSTATASQLVSEMASTENAAIASAVTAKYYNLEILQEDIQDDPRDYTRFVIIAANHTARKLFADKKANTASFVFATANETGALCNALNVFKQKGLNLTRLECRPIKGQPWHYWFYADAQLCSKEMQNEIYVHAFMEELKKVSEDVRLLGVYSEPENSI